MAGIIRTGNRLTGASILRRGGRMPTFNRGEGRQGDPDFASVSLLLAMDGTNGSTTFTDSSSNALTITPAGNAQISTAQGKFGSQSAYFDGTGDYLDVPGSALFSFPGDFTVECWVRLDTANNATDQTIIELGTYLDGILIRGCASTADSVYVNGTNLGSLNTFFSSATWGFVQVKRSGTAVTVSVDGTSRLTGTVSGTVNSTNAASRIGALRSFSGQAMAGYVEDLRVTKGVARPSTVPAAAFPTL